MDVIILTTIIALVSGTSTPLPQNPRLFLQVQPPIKPTKASDQTAASITQEGMGPQNPSMDTGPVVDNTATDTSTVAKTGNGNIPAIEPTRESPVSDAPNIRISVSTAKFGPLNVETQDTATGQPTGNTNTGPVRLEPSVPVNTDNKNMSATKSLSTDGLRNGAKPTENSEIIVNPENTSIDKYVSDLNLPTIKETLPVDSYSNANSGLNQEAAMMVAESDTATHSNKNATIGSSSVDSSIDNIVIEDAMGEPLSGTNPEKNETKPRIKPEKPTSTGRTGIKNRENVPTASELLDAAIDANLVPFQVRLEDPSLMINTNDSTTNVEETANKVGEKKIANTTNAPIDGSLSPGAIKNRENVPTGRELNEKGVFDSMAQVRIEGPPIVHGPPQGAIKNRDNVPTAGELAKSGMDTSEISKMQFRMNDLPPPKNAKGKMFVSGDVILPQNLGGKDTEVTISNTEPSSQTNLMSPIANENATDTSNVRADLLQGQNTQSEPNEATTTEATTNRINGNETSGFITEAHVDFMNTDSNTTITDSNGGVANGTTLTDFQTNATEVEQNVNVTSTVAPAMTTPCSTIACNNTCQHGYRINYKGCRTCQCKFSTECPPVLPVSRLLCLLQVRSSLSCDTDANCKANRICCPGTCGAMCRRRSNKRRAMLLSILDGGL